jgi:hypothetical protein
MQYSFRSMFRPGRHDDQADGHDVVWSRDRGFQSHQSRTGSKGSGGTGTGSKGSGGTKGSGGAGGSGGSGGSGGTGGSGGASGTGGSGGSTGSGGSCGSGGSGGSSVPCFVAGTLVETRKGLTPVETLALGDEVLTLDEGYQPVLWSGQQRFSQTALARNPRLRPIRIGPEPRANISSALIVSPQHRVLCRGSKTQLHFGVEEVLAPAIGLLSGELVDQLPPEGPVTYHHFLLPRHHIIRANGRWSESLFPGDMALSAMSADARQAISAALADHGNDMKTARLCLTATEAAILADQIDGHGIRTKILSFRAA